MLAATGRVDEGLAEVDEALRYARNPNSFGGMPEALRIKGEVLLLLDKTETTAAENHFRRSLDLAHRQSALSGNCGRPSASPDCGASRTASGKPGLLAGLGRFTEGFGTADLRTARRLLDELS